MMTRTRPASCPRSLLPVLLCASLVGEAAAQCSNLWQSAGVLAGTNGTVRALLTWDPDGAGPAHPVWVVGGDYTVAGAGPAAYLAVFDPIAQAWSPLGGGTNGPVWALTSLANGDLVVGGEFTSAGGISASRVARWNGTTWSPLGSGCSDTVRALAVRP